MKIKVNLDKDTVTIKNMTPMQFSIVNTLLNHVRLGQGPYDGGASDAAFELLEVIEGAAEDLELFGVPEINFSAVPSEEIDGLMVILDSPTLELYAD